MMIYDALGVMQGSPDRGTMPRILPHPLEDLQLVEASASPQMQHEGLWRGEIVIWTSIDSPCAATVNEV